MKTVYTEAEEAMLPLLNNTLVHGVDGIEEAGLAQPRKSNQVDPCYQYSFDEAQNSIYFPHELETMYMLIHCGKIIL